MKVTVVNWNPLPGELSLPCPALNLSIVVPARLSINISRPIQAWGGKGGPIKHSPWLGGTRVERCLSRAKVDLGRLDVG